MVCKWQSALGIAVEGETERLWDAETWRLRDRRIDDFGLLIEQASDREYDKMAGHYLT